MVTTRIAPRVKVSGIPNLLGPLIIPALKVGGGPVTLNPPRSNSPAPWTYVSSDPYIVRIDGNVATALVAGSVTISAMQVAFGGFASGKATSFVTVTRILPDKVSNFVIGNKFLCSTPFTIPQPTSNSNGAWTYTSSNPQILSVSGNVATPTGLGTCVITATQAATATVGAGIITANVTVTTQTDTLGPFTIPSMVSGTSQTIQPPTALSSGSWSYSSSNPNVATVSGNTITSVGAGQCVITATRSGDHCYGTASTVANLTVSPQAASIGPLTIPLTVYFCSPAFTIPQPTSNSDGAWSYTSMDPTVISISGNVATIMGNLGTVTIVARQAATATYGEMSVSTVVTAIPKVNNIDPSTSFAISNKTVSDAPFTLTPPTSSNTSTPWVFVSNTPSTIKVSGNVATIVGLGYAEISATQPANACYGTIRQIASFTISQAPNNIGPLTIPPKLVGDPPFTITPPTSNSGGAWSYTSSDPSVMTVSGNTITVVGLGSSVITAKQAATPMYPAASTTGIGIVTAPEYTLDITQHAMNYSVMNGLVAKYGNTVASAPCSVTVTVAPGIWVYSDNVQLFALYVDRFAVGSTVKLINHGFIAGKGGQGGTNAQLPYALNGKGIGQNGGDAIYANVPLVIDNTDPNAYIGGGGGGGGSQFTTVTTSVQAETNNGGGGGGAGGGKGGTGSYDVTFSIAKQQMLGGDGGSIGSPGSIGMHSNKTSAPNVPALPSGGAGNGGGAGGGGGIYGGGGGGGGRQFPGVGGLGGDYPLWSGPIQAGEGGSGNGDAVTHSTAANAGGGGGGWGKPGGNSQAHGGGGGRAVATGQYGKVSYVNNDKTRVYG